MANWRWYSRTKNLLNTLTFWLDTISIPLVAVLLCAGFISGNEKYSVVIVIYVMVWIVYLLYIVAPLMSIECIGRILYTLTVKDNFPVLVSWIVGGFRKSEILVTQSKPYTNSKNWLTEGFKQPPEEQ